MYSVVLKCEFGPTHKTMATYTICNRVYFYFYFLNEVQTCKQWEKSYILIIAHAYATFKNLLTQHDQVTEIKLYLICTIKKQSELIDSHSLEEVNMELCPGSGCW